jgi:hypothetical protein
LLKQLHAKSIFGRDNKQACHPSWVGGELNDYAVRRKNLEESHIVIITIALANASDFSWGMKPAPEGRGNCEEPRTFQAQREKRV